MAPLFAPFSQPLVRLKHFLAFQFPSSLWSPVSAAGLRATRSSQKRSQKTWMSEEPHVEIEGTGAPQLRLGRIIKLHQGNMSNMQSLGLFVSICGNRFVFFDRDALRPSRRLRLTPGRTC